MDGKSEKKITIPWLKFGCNPDGTFFQGEFTASYAELVQLLGPPNSERDDHKVSTEWNLLHRRDPITVYDWKMTAQYQVGLMSVEEFRALPSYEWHVGAHSESAAREFIAAVRKALADQKSL